MKSIAEILNKLFNYDHNEIVKKFAKEELNDVNYQIRNLLEKRDHLEHIAYGN